MRIDTEMGFGMRLRKGLPQMKPKMMRVLLYLEACKAQGFPWVHLPEGLVWYQHSLRAMQRPPRCWIMASDGLDGVRYKLMPAGERALKVYRPVVRRRDGICPVCGERPRHVSPKTGRRYGYCVECEREHKRKLWKLNGGKQLKLEGLCMRCKQRPRRVNSVGKTDGYCVECKKEMRAGERKRRNERDLARIRNGEVLLCRKCKAAPRWVAKNSVYDYCHACYREYKNTRYANQRRAAQGG